MGTAYLKLLVPRNNSVAVDIDNVVETLKKLNFNEVLSVADYNPGNSNGQLVIWRLNPEDTIPDVELAKIVGNKGHVLYVSECEHCKSINSRCSYVNL